ncbi:Gfo/Idh/MocA family oxidoreductase [Vibrio kyushuensis]|uniref:Gfo/Idh/MocA family protein n=1 Tax=Vibrio kyushuensis TaxID=2910249 RepID=UPI003D0BE380
MSKRIRIGMIGGGLGAFIGPIHRIAARLDDQYQLVSGVFSHNEANNTESAKQLHIESSRCYSNYHLMFEQERLREDGIEAVIIVTPNHLHFDAAKAALEVGLAVICEKPMTLSFAQAKELHDLEKHANVPFLLTHTYCGYPLVQEAKARIEQGKLGDIVSFSVEYLQEWLTEKPESDNRQAVWRLNPELAGAAGCLGDIGTHAFQLASYVTGRSLTSISANLNRFIEGRLVDDNVQASLTLEGNLQGQLWASQTAAGHENALRIRVIGTKASIEWAQESPNELWFTPYNAPRQRITRRADFLNPFAASNTRTPGGHPEGYLEAFGNLYCQFASVIRGNNEYAHWLPNAATGLQGLQFIESAILSNNRNGARIDVEALA